MNFGVSCPADAVFSPISGKFNKCPLEKRKIGFFSFYTFLQTPLETIPGNIVNRFFKLFLEVS